MRALGFGFVAAFITFVLWLALTVLIGLATDSGPGGICGPSGPFGGILFLMVLASPFVSLLIGIIAAINDAKKTAKLDKDDPGLKAGEK